MLLILPGLISLFVNGLRVGIDFSGGTVWDIMIPNHSTPLSTDEVAAVFEGANLESSVQVSPPDAQNRVFAAVRTPEVRESSPEKTKVTDALTAAFPGAVLERFETVGAT